jgi:CubicO group peptidase (beta-lactamase class C family)
MTRDGASHRDLWDRLAGPYQSSHGGTIVAILSPELKTAQYRGYGVLDAARPTPPDANTLFEIGSITKVFTSILLAKMILDGRVDLDAPIGSLLAELSSAPAWITLRSLATHTSGLPRVPIPFHKLLFLSLDNPYASFGATELTTWMDGYRPKGPPKSGRGPSYSNLGVGLLGYALAKVAGSTYDAVLKAEVLDPLGLSDTGIVLSADQQARLATPHSSSGKAVRPWDFDALAGAGALRSTAADLASFARAVIGAPEAVGPLHAAICLSLRIQVPPPKAGGPGQCLGWLCVPAAAGRPTIYMHDGGTHGSLSFLAIAPEVKIACVVLANTGPSLWREIRIARSRPLGVLDEMTAAIQLRRKGVPSAP